MVDEKAKCSKKATGPSLARVLRSVDGIVMHMYHMECLESVGEEFFGRGSAQEVDRRVGRGGRRGKGRRDGRMLKAGV